MRLGKQCFWLTMVLAGLWAAGCGDDEPSGDTDASVQQDGSFDGSTTSDAGDDGGSTTMDSGTTFDECSFTDPSGLTAFSASFVAAGGATPPAGTGGDPSGLWLFDAATFYLDASTSMQVDASMSSASVMSWAEFEGNAFKIKYNADLTLALQAGGTQNATASLAFGGTYTAGAGSLDFEQSCQSGTVSIASLEYTVSGSDVTLIIELESGLVGVFEGSKAP